MSIFHDSLKRDLNNTFFNSNEFAVDEIIYGKSMKIVYDDDLLKKYNSKLGEGLSKGEVLFHVAVENFDERPFIQDIIRLKNKIYRISDISENNGMYTITLEGNFS